MSSVYHTSSGVPFDWDALTFDPVDDDLATGQRWSTWTSVERLSRGPEPRPDWVVTSEAAVDTELGVLKTGKEADVFLLERAVPDDPARHSLLAAKRYRTAEHRLFRRDDGYTQGRVGRDSRENRAVRNGSAFGRDIEAVRWANAEFATLSLLYSEGVPVPYPVQIDGREVLMEFVAESDAAAPRLAQTSPTPDELAELWQQLVGAMTTMARLHLAHADLSPYNALVRGLGGGRPELFVIDVPQAVDLVANPDGVGYLHRDCRTMASWFVRRGLDVDADALLAELLAAAW